MHASILVLCAVLGPMASSSCSQTQGQSEMADSLEAFLDGRVTATRLSIEYTDLHGLWGGLRLIVRGDGKVNQEALRIEAGQPSDLSREDVERLVKLILENRAWVQETPERDPKPDEARAYLRVSVGGERGVIWEWYNDMQETDRLIRIRNLMTELAWKRVGRGETPSH